MDFHDSDKQSQDPQSTREAHIVVCRFGGIPSGTPTVDPKRFKDPSADQWAHHWAAGSKPASWAGIPKDVLLSHEAVNLIRRTIGALPENHRLLITLHDQDDLSTQEICNILGISETTQRVLLHRARTRVRQALEDCLELEHESMTK